VCSSDLRSFGLVLAILLHAAAILFGGLLLGESKDKEHRSTTREVELLSNDSTEKKDEKPKEPVEKTEDMKTENEKPPDAESLMRDMQQSAAADSPGLDALSISAIESLLSGKTVSGGGADFGPGGSLMSGGRIGGTGRGRSMEDSKLENAFNPNEIDQKPRVAFQAAPVYPAEMSGKKVEGVVSVIFIVDASGKVLDLRVEKASHPAFEKPALDAVRQWRFEPAIKGGQRVACKMRVPIRFQRS